MTVEDVVDMLRINKSTVYRMAKTGRIPATRVGRQWRFRLSALEDFLDGGGDQAFVKAAETQEDERKVVNRWYAFLPVAKGSFGFGGQFSATGMCLAAQFCASLRHPKA